MTQTTPLQNDFRIILDVQGILEFNSKSDEGHIWGDYQSPFLADQFFKLYVNEVEPVQIPLLSPEVSIQLTVEANSDLFKQTEHIELSLIGGHDLTSITPKQAWSEVIDLEQTHGALGNSDKYFLDTTKGENEVFYLCTSPEVNDRSPNLRYGLTFSIDVFGSIKYCRIDPLLRTSTEDTPNPVS